MKKLARKHRTSHPRNERTSMKGINKFSTLDFRILESKNIATMIIACTVLFLYAIQLNGCIDSNLDDNFSNDIQLSGQFSATSYAKDETMIVTAIVKNHSVAPITFEEGLFFLVLDYEGEAITFVESVVHSYASGRKKITVQPGDEHCENFKVHLGKNNNQRQLSPGKYKVHISYSGADSWRPSINPVKNKIQNGIVEAMDSEVMIIEIHE